MFARDGCYGPSLFSSALLSETFRPCFGSCIHAVRASLIDLQKLLLL